MSSLMSGVNQLASALFATFFPSDCRICSNPLLNVSRLPVCNECLAAMRPLPGPLCSICGERLTGFYGISEPDTALCDLCRRAEPPFVKASAYGSYEGGLRDLIHLLKYDQVRPAANVLGRMMAEAIADLQSLFSQDQILVVPVPLFWRKKRQRSFNQAELIASAALKLTRDKRFHLETDILERRRETQSQIGLSRHQRRENMRGAFEVTNAGGVSGREVLVVDDVFTTGTTVSECARVLRRAGAKTVFVATVARTLKAEHQSAQIEETQENVAVMAAAG